MKLSVDCIEQCNPYDSLAESKFQDYLDRQSAGIKFFRLHKYSNPSDNLFLYDKKRIVLGLIKGVNEPHQEIVVT